MTAVESSLDSFKQQGYAVFKKVYDEPTMEAMRAGLLKLNHASADRAQWWFGNTVEHLPDLMFPQVSNPVLLNFAERIIGPFLQLDNLTLAAFPNEGGQEVAGKVKGWHRDRWARVPDGAYHRPLAFNAISYLQDLDDQNGPLRVIPRSHIDPITIADDQQKDHRPDEILIYPEAGDVVFTHNGLIHSGTYNVSDDLRYFFSIFYNHCWLKHTDTHDGPNCKRIIAEALDNKDHRILRLFGADEQLQARCNWGFLSEEAAKWQEWIAADEDAHAPG